MNIDFSLEKAFSENPKLFFYLVNDNEEFYNSSHQQILSYISSLEKADLSNKNYAWAIIGLEILLFLGAVEQKTIRKKAFEKLNLSKIRYSRINKISPANYISQQSKPVVPC